MIKVRKAVFETNSSSTHSITICSKKDFDDWKAGKCFYNVETETFVQQDLSKVDEYREEAIQQYRSTRDNDPYSISWDSLPPEQQEKYIEAHVKYRLEQNQNSYYNMTYDHYRYYHKEGCEYSEVFFKTEHGDEVVAFGKGGYDG